MAQKVRAQVRVFLENKPTNYRGIVRDGIEVGVSKGASLSLAITGIAVFLAEFYLNTKTVNASRAVVEINKTIKRLEELKEFIKQQSSGEMQ